MTKIQNIPLFIVDTSVLVEMFEGNNDKYSLDVLNKLRDMKAKGLPFKAATTLSAFLRAIWKANSNCTIKEIQNAIETFKIMPTFECDYKDKKKVTNDIIKFANAMSGGKNEG